MSGDGRYEDGVEPLRRRRQPGDAALARAVLPVGLRHRNPDTIDLAEWQEDRGIVHVRKAGELLFRVKPALQ